MGGVRWQQLQHAVLLALLLVCLHTVPRSTASLLERELHKQRMLDGSTPLTHVAYVTHMGRRILSDIRDKFADLPLDQPGLIVSLGNHLQPPKVTFVNKYARTTALRAQVHRLMDLLDKYVPNAYFIGALGDAERAYVGSTWNELSASIQKRNDRISELYNVPPQYKLISDAAQDRDFTLYGIGEAHILGDIQIMLLGAPTEGYPFQHAQSKQILQQIIDQMMVSSPFTKGRTPVFRVCASSTVPARRFHLAPDEKRDSMPSQGELCRHLGAAWFTGSDLMMGRSKEITNMRLPHDPLYSPRPFLVEPQPFLGMLQDFWKAVPKYLLGLGRTFIVQVGVGDAAKPVRCYRELRPFEAEYREASAQRAEQLEMNLNGKKRKVKVQPPFLHPNSIFYPERVCESPTTTRGLPPNGYTFCQYPAMDENYYDGVAGCKFRTFDHWQLPKKEDPFMRQKRKRKPFLITSSSLVPNVLLTHELQQAAMRIENEPDTDPTSRPEWVASPYAPPMSTLKQLCGLGKYTVDCIYDSFARRYELAKTAVETAQRARPYILEQEMMDADDEEDEWYPARE